MRHQLFYVGLSEAGIPVFAKRESCRPPQEKTRDIHPDTEDMEEVEIVERNPKIN